MAPGCKPGRLTPYAGSNPAPCTSAIANLRLRISDLKSAFLNQQSEIVVVGGCSSVGRASAFQAEGREFESRRPLQKWKDEVGRMKDEDRVNVHPSAFVLHPCVARVAQG